MNAILIILLTGFAVLGAYFLADVLTGSSEIQYTGPAVVAISTPLQAGDAAELTMALRELMPRCEVLCIAAEEDEQMPADCWGYQGVSFVTRERLSKETAARLDLQNQTKSI